jgi:hypothetical protein
MGLSSAAREVAIKDKTSVIDRIHPHLKLLPMPDRAGREEMFSLLQAGIF